MGVIKTAGAGVVAHSASNALLASAATVVTLLVWANLMARVVLYAAAWMAVPPTASSRVGSRPQAA
jgi:membrane protein